MGRQRRRRWVSRTSATTMASNEQTAPVSHITRTCAPLVPNENPTAGIGCTGGAAAGTWAPMARTESGVAGAAVSGESHGWSTGTSGVCALSAAGSGDVTGANSDIGAAQGTATGRCQPGNAAKAGTNSTATSPIVQTRWRVVAAARRSNSVNAKTAMSNRVAWTATANMTFDMVNVLSCAPGGSGRQYARVPPDRAPKHHRPDGPRRPSPANLRKTYARRGETPTWRLEFANARERRRTRAPADGAGDALCPQECAKACGRRSWSADRAARPAPSRPSR